MNAISETFNPEIHICKFGFEYCGVRKDSYKIYGNLYLMELSFVFPKESFGFHISLEQLETLLPLIRWDDFEKIRDYRETYQNGYREYLLHFWCLSESGNSLIQKYMGEFSDLPHEKLLDWIRINFGHEKKLRKKMIYW